MIDEHPYAELLRKASFRCPIRRNPMNCDGHPCPFREENSLDDYYDECVDALYARMELSESKIKDDANGRQS